MPSLIVESALGQIEIGLENLRAPETCAYFLKLAEAKAFRDGRVFRIVDANKQMNDDKCPIQVVQLGLQEMLDAPRDSIVHESTQTSGLSHKRWTVSAARFGPGELYGSFFVCLRDEPELNYRGRRNVDGLGFAAFGHIESGHDVVETLGEHSEKTEILTRPIRIHDITVRY